MDADAQHRCTLCLTRPQRRLLEVLASATEPLHPHVIEDMLYLPHVGMARVSQHGAMGVFLWRVQRKGHITHAPGRRAWSITPAGRAALADDRRLHP